LQPLPIQIAREDRPQLGHHRSAALTGVNFVRFRWTFFADSAHQIIIEITLHGDENVSHRLLAARVPRT